MTAASPHVKGGKAVAVAQTRLQRSKAFPQVPTVAEEGFPGFDASTWYGLAGPGRLAPAIVKRMNEDVNRVLAMTEVTDRLALAGAEDSGGTPERFADFMRGERAKYLKLAKDASIRIDS